MIALLSKVIALIFAIIVISKSIVDYKNKEESLTMTSFWSLIWLAIGIIALFPTIIDKLITLLGGNRTGLGTIFGMAFVFVTYVSYRIYVKCQRVENKLAKIVSALALKDVKDGK